VSPNVFQVATHNRAALEAAQAKEVAMPSINQQTSPHGTGSGHGRRIAILAAILAVAIGVLLLVLYGGGGSSTGY
jgi:hypothetical protein